MVVACVSTGSSDLSQSYLTGGQYFLPWGLWTASFLIRETRVHPHRFSQRWARAEFLERVGRRGNPSYCFENKPSGLFLNRLKTEWGVRNTVSFKIKVILVSCCRILYDNDNLITRRRWMMNSQSERYQYIQHYNKQTGSLIQGIREHYDLDHKTQRSFSLKSIDNC